jgi:D-tyrosyl-tRNA(Tyr) deacylase
MRLVIQRVSAATVKIEDNLVDSIGNGLLVLLGIECDDDKTDVIWLVKKLLNMRIFNDTDGVIVHLIFVLLIMRLLFRFMNIF